MPTQYSGLVYKDILNSTPEKPIYYLVNTSQTPGNYFGECADGCHTLIDLSNGKIIRITQDTLLAKDYLGQKPKNYEPVTGQTAIDVLTAFSESEFNKIPGTLFGSSKFINKEDITSEGLCSKTGFKYSDHSFPVCNKNYTPNKGGRKSKRKYEKKSKRKYGKKSKRKYGKKSRK